MGPSVAHKEKGMGILPSTSDGNFSRGYPAFPPVVSLAKYSLVASQARAKSCRVATRATISAILSGKISILVTFFLRFFHLSPQFEGGYTCDFHLVLATRQNLK